MPKASMDKDQLTAIFENDIRLSGKILNVQPITISESVKGLTHPEFRLCILAPDLLHVVPSDNRIDCVHPSTFIKSVQTRHHERNQEFVVDARDISSLAK
jgi:hypothetical protein